MKSITTVATFLSFGSMAYTASTIASTCPTTDVCYALNIPDTTASSGSGDIYFQISAPTSYEWVALGQGTGMAGSNIFLMYTSADGSNVTVSPRLGRGHIEPQHDTSASIELLAGSGVSNGKMIANVRCSNCNSWNGGTMDFTSSSGSNWIYAYKTGSALNTNDLSTSISRHDNADTFTWNLASARGGQNVNPFVTAAATNGPSGNATSTTNTTTTTSSPKKKKKTSDHILLAHAVLASLAIVALLPAGGILIRVASFPGLIWVHAAIQLLGWAVYIAAFGLGLWYACNFNYLSRAHPRIGIVIFALLALQPVFGLVHHLMFKKHGRRTIVSYVHANLGRVIILLGMINGGLGLKLASAKKNDMIAYGVCAGVMGVLYLAAIIFGEAKRSKQNKSAPAGLGHGEPMSERDQSSDRVSKEDPHGGQVEEKSHP